MRYPLTCGIVERPLRVVVYGPEGIGKTTLAATAPSPILIDTEDGSHQLPVARLPRPESWGRLLDEVAAVAEDPSLCSTLVVDTLDGAESLCAAHVCAAAKRDSIEAFGYGKGYVVLREEFQRLLAALDAVVAAGVNVVCASHSQLRKFERPDELGAYDRFEMKLTRHVAPIVKEWCDVLLLADYQTYVTCDERGGRAKASGGRRVLRTTHSPSWDAKNRLGLPETMDLDIGPLLPHMPDHLAGGARRGEDGPADELAALMARDGVTAAEVEEVVAARGHQPKGTPLSAYPEGLRSWLAGQWPAVMEAIEINGIEMSLADTEE